MLKPQGYATIVEPDQPLREFDSAQCGHCQRVLLVKPGTGSTVYLVPDKATNTHQEVPGAFCRCCMRPVCLRCERLGRCRPFERQLEKSEARGRFLRSVGL